MCRSKHINDKKPIIKEYNYSGTKISYMAMSVSKVQVKTKSKAKSEFNIGILKGIQK